MLRGALLAALLTAVALAGCSGKGPGPSEGGGVAAPQEMSIVGLVQNETFAPVAGAQVSLRLTEHSATTDAGGLFTFRGLPMAPYLVDVVAAGFENATLSAAPQANVSLGFVLVKPLPLVPEPVTVHFTGYFECAFEALIIPGSCDFFLNGTGQDVFDDRNVFQTALGPRWATAVVDVDFDPQAGLDGLHVTLRAPKDADEFGEYEQYGQFGSSGPFSFRVEPGQSYPGGVQPMPGNATTLRLHVYPQGYGYHALCSPPAPEGAVGPGQCPLGVGTAMNVQFDLYVTTFFVDPAPEGFTLLA